MAWQIDPAHSSVTFSTRHMMLTKVRGSFTKFEGTVDVTNDDPATAAVEVKIDAMSLETKDDNRDNHLRSPDFLNAEQFPHVVFKGTRMEVLGNEQGKLYGDLTIRDVTKPVVLDVEYHGQSKSPWGQTAAGFSATTKINREEWGLTWNVALETGGVLVGKEITIEIDVELVKQPESVGEPEAVAA